MKGQKGVLDRRVAATLGMNTADVAAITQEFFHQLSLELASVGEVTIETFGLFRVRTKKFKDGIRPRFRTPKGREHSPLIKEFKTITFTKAEDLRRILYGRNDMDKLGVDEDIDQEELEKKASEGCPECGRTPTRHGRVLICPEHGSEPFERKG